MRAMDENEIMAVLESVVIRDSLSLFMTKLTEQHRTHPDYQATMQFVGSLYKKFARIAAQKVTKDEVGNYTIRRNMRTDFDLN